VGLCEGGWSDRLLVRFRYAEPSTYTDVAMRYLSGDTHPDHDTLCTFRRRNGALLEQAFVGCCGWRRR
jgi:hypothetical protein